MKIAFFDRALRQPQGLWVRRAIFQIHLWASVVVGLYVFVICLSGSALVFRNELHEFFSRPPTLVEMSGRRLTEDELKQAALRAYPDYEVTQVWEPRRPNYAVEVSLVGDGDYLDELFNPFTGEHLGHAEPVMVSFIVWLAFLHDDLLMTDNGRTINGIGGLLLVLISLTGAVVWWPGIQNWRRSLVLDWRANWKRFNWTLHSAIGFWMFIVVFMFAFTGFYLVFQEPFIAIVDYFEPLSEGAIGRRRRTGDQVLRWFSRLHFGRFGWQLGTVWVVLGLIPPVLFVTGAIMWWNRVVAPKWLARLWTRKIGGISESARETL